MPRFDQSFSGLCEQNFQDTLQLKQRFLDTKAKRAPKAKDKKQQESIQSSVHVQQKFLKRSAEDHDPGGPNDNYEPPVKLQCTTQQHGSSHQNEGLTKFSVEIVQQLEFTTSAANSQPQQISTNVTVKTHANASVKSDVASPKSNPSTPSSNLQQKSNIGLDVGTIVECVKQEPDNDFADLDQCAAALEKDAAANGGAAFGGFPDLIGDDTNDEIMSAAAFKDLISDLSYPDLMKFDFEENKMENNTNGMKSEDIKDLPPTIPSDNSKSTHSPLLPNQNNYSPPVFEGQNINKSRIPSYSNMDFTKTELSPAAQTLKQMAEQHQHKNQMGLSFNPNSRAPNPRSPYTDFQFQGDYGSPNSNTNFHKNSPNFPNPDMIKQEMIFQSNEFDMKRKGSGMYKQPYSPYSSPSASSHGSPGYLPSRSGQAPNAAPSQGAFGGGTPPRPPSGPGGNNSGSTLQINQAQQLNINQQNHSIQVSAGQHLHLSGELKGNVSIAAQQGLQFNQHSGQNASQAQPNTQQTQMPQNASQTMQNNLNSQHNPNMNQSQSGPQLGGSMMSGGQQIPNSQMNNQQGPMGGGMSNQGMQNAGMPGQNPNGMQNNMGGGLLGGPGMQQIPGGMSNMSQQHPESYSMSQTQTINFTQQSLRRANGPGIPNSMVANGPMGNNVSMGPNGPMGPGVMGGQGQRLLNSQTMEQKLLQQQQMLRAQQQAAMQQQQMVRPPPPDYKTGMMQGVQPRYTAGPPNIRRMPHQPMPPSGPMIRSNIYVMQQQQQHMTQRNIYPRQQGPMGGMEQIQHGSTEWRHLMMTQQQNSNFNNIRPNFQQGGFNMNSGNMQMNAIQHQQMRSQGMVSNNMANNQQSLNAGLGQVMSHGNNPMAQMNNMNQAMLSHMQQQQQQQQQQQNLMQQQNSQMSMTSIHMQQSQSITISNQNLQQQQQQQQQHPMNNQLVSSNIGGNSQSNSDFNFEFLDNLPDSTSFTDQELLNSFDPGFNFDI